MESKILKIAKRLKTFTLDDIIMFSELKESEIVKFLEKSENIKQSGKYFEYMEIPKTVDNFKIIDKNIKCESSEITVIAACETFLKFKKNALSPMSYQTYKTFTYAKIIPYFSKYKLKNITITNIQNFKSLMMKNNVSERKIKNILALLNQIIKHFQNEGVIPQTCIFEVKRLEKIPKREVQILTSKQLVKLFKIVSKNYSYLESIIKTMITENKKLNEILHDTQNKEHIKRKIRKDFYKIKQQMGLENYMIEDLRFCKQCAKIH
ncbi:MAG: N-terminal phage integrase SAM-like domain-containing protein [Clostridiaceae bacterium]|jgi:hypothetical protein|nr:N-terminal phage integrase SAM-like domain-containing protein [Clostridiaceae bacterium]